jgi:acetyl esterase
MYVLPPPSPLDPEIAEFVVQMRSDAGLHPPRESVPIVQAREIAEKVRGRWAQGGPAMARTRDLMVPTRHQPVRIRVYEPATEMSAPAFVYLHGGGWVLFSIETHDRLMREYAARTGRAVIGVDYSRAPEARFPQPVEEVVDILRWLAGEGGAELDLDLSRMVLGGDSAGGNISVAAAMILRDAGHDILSALVLNYGSYDMGALSESVVRYGGGDYMLTTHMMHWFRWHYLRGPDDASHAHASPLYGSLNGLPPALLVVAECDPLHDGNVAMNEALKRAGNDVELRVYPGTVHSFLEAMSIAAVARRALDETADWLRDR